jgi:NADH-quinone oxidoreductase subunit N
MASMVVDVLPELVLVAGGVLVLLYALIAPQRAQPGAALLALGVTLVALAVSIGMLAGSESLTFFATYARDRSAIWAKLIVLAATIAVIGLSVPWFRRDPRHGEYYTLLLYSALGAILLAGATDLKEFIVAMLLSSATGFVLSAYHRRSSPAAEAAIKYYLIGALANSALLFGVALLFGLAGSTTLGGLSSGLPAHGGPALVVGVALVIVGLAFKIGAVPAHAWVPDVAQGAPAPVAAFVTTVPKIGGFLFLARFVLALPPDAAGWQPLVAILATATMTLGNLACLWQDDVRRLLGWSAVSQTGYGLMAIVASGRAISQSPRCSSSCSPTWWETWPPSASSSSCEAGRRSPITPVWRASGPGSRARSRSASCRSSGCRRSPDSSRRSSSSSSRSRSGTPGWQSWPR